MARIVLDPDEVNQGRVVTLTDGRTIPIADADRAVLGRVSRQLARYRSVYADAYVAPDGATADALRRGDLTFDEVAPLLVAVRQRHAAVKDAPGRGALDVDPTALLDAERWTTGGGVVKRLEDLTPSHRRNLLGWLDRHDEALRAAAEEHLSADELARIHRADPWVAGTPVHRALRALEERADATELAKDEARQIARRIHFEATGRWPTD